MRIYSLTPIGQNLSRSVSSDNTPGWKVVYFLKRHGGRATDDQIAEFIGLPSTQLNRTMDNLVRQKVVTVAS